MDIRVRRVTRSWTVCKYTYISEVNISSLRHPCQESDSWNTHWRCARWSGKGFLSRRSSWNHSSRLQEAPQFTTSWPSSCPAAIRYKLNPQQSIPTTACSAVVRESQCGQVWQFLSAYHRSSHFGCLAVTGSLTYYTVWSRSGRSSTRVMPLRAPACLSCREPGHDFAGVRSCDTTVLWFTFFGTVWCIIQCCAAAQNYATALTQPIYFATAAPQATALPSWWTRMKLNFNASSQPKLPTLGPFSPFFASGVVSWYKKSTFCLDHWGKGLAPGGATHNKNTQGSNLWPSTNGLIPDF